ncbi:MAG TPA: alpha-amylase family glycosyl hydrolase [Myxococcota bacterium]|nr:alpha-amylase family glycosyl hydrolase [Myxococcota bacterium]HRY93285.1 alpha-amylase family glycosyl hydrolase [Myxococcota bacterium]
MLKTCWPGLVLLLALAAGCDDGGVDLCAAVDCGSHGSCALVDGLPACACDPGYTADGRSCILDPCSSSPCVHGTCSPSGRNAVCACEAGYGGPLCDSCAAGYHAEELVCLPGSPCADDPCVYGLCRSVDGLARCECQLGYAGERCDGCAPGFVAEGLRCVADLACDPDPCVHGTCAPQAGVAVCSCREGYAGERCDACAAGYHAEELYCVPDIGGPCDPNPCQEANRTRCQVADGEAVCLCDPGYHEDAGACVADTACEPNPCQEAHRGVCQDDGAGGHTCACDPGYHEEEGACAVDTACSPNPCPVGEHRGRCQDDGAGGHTCLCDPGYHEDAGACVQDTSCDPLTTCAGHGQCTGAGLECACDAGYAGANCADCAAGYHAAGGLCVSDTSCQPNPCTQPDRTRCVTGPGGEAVCLCDEGLREEAGLCLGVCDTLLSYTPAAGENITRLYARGEWNGWGLGDELARGEDGVYRVVLELAAGDYAYKLFEQGAARWFEHPGNPYFKWFGTPATRNSRLHVRDCDQPLLRLVAQPSVGPGSIAFQVEYLDGAAGAGVDPAGVEATRNDAPIPGAFDPATGLFTIQDTGLPDGKQTYRFRARDQAGRAAERLYVPVWLEAQPFAWEDAVLYFAMTDRFVNGDAGNDAPVGGVVDYRADWQGGDFAGLLAKVESGYFTELGVNTLWLSSVTMNTQGAGQGSGADTHYYTGYHSYWPITLGWREGQEFPGLHPVEPHFGELAELKALVAAAHARGIRVLVDFVANHVHADSPLWTEHGWAWFNDDPNTAGQQPYICGWDQPIICWFAAYLPDFDYRVLEAMDTVVEHAIWLIQETDVDGFRLDAVKHMIHDFCYTLRGRIQESVTTTGLRFYMVGETFTGEGEGEASLIRSFVRPEELDGQFDFPLFWQMVTVFLREERTYQSLEGFLQQFQGYYGDWAVMSNFLGNHDVPRAISHANGDIADMWGNGARDQGWNDPPGAPTAALPFKKLRLGWTFLLSVPGIPMVYYGDEYGLPGAGDPDNRRMMQFGAQLNSEQALTLQHLQRLGQARAAHPAMRYGSRQQLALDGDGLYWAFGLSSGADRVVVVFNRKADPQTRSIPVAALGLADGTSLRDVVHQTNASVSGGNLSVTLPSRDSAVFVLE